MLFVAFDFCKITKQNPKRLKFDVGLTHFAKNTGFFVFVFLTQKPYLLL
jgi:hypothetical protein